jgi:hypothetical protein
VARHVLVRLVWALYPALVVFSIVATANHFILDAVAGLGILLVAVTAVLALHRSQGWSLRPLRDRSPAGTDRSSRPPGERTAALRPSDR